MRILNKSFLVFLSILLCLKMACRTVDSKSPVSKTAQAEGGQPAITEQINPDLKLCTSITGNGQYLYAHFGALSTILEDIGWIDMVAGGSSASVTSFLYSSMAGSKAIADCGSDEACKRRRMAAMLKSLTGFAMVMANPASGGENGDVIDALGLRDVFTWLMSQQDSWVDENGQPIPLSQAQISELISKLFDESNESFQKVAKIINPDVILLARNLKFNEVYKIISFPMQWKLAEQGMLIRPGLVNFDFLAESVNLLAHFYHGRSDSQEYLDVYDEFIDVLAECSGDMKGDVAYWKTPNTCAEKIMTIMGSYKALIGSSDLITSSSYLLGEPVGEQFPALIHSAMLTGSSAASTREDYREYADYLASLNSASPLPAPQSPIAYESVFSDIQIGYWGRPQDLQRLADASNDDRLFPEMAENDAYRFRWENYSQKALLFTASDPRTANHLSWKEALLRSPAEPGLASLVPTGPNWEIISAGGWPNGRSVHNLKRIGCDEVIAVTLTGISKYSVEVLNNLAAEPETERPSWVDYFPRNDADYDSTSKSWWYKELDAADATFCVDWGLFPGSKIIERYDLGYEYFHFYDPENKFTNRLSGNDYHTRASAEYRPGVPTGCLLTTEFDNTSPF